MRTIKFKNVAYNPTYVVSVKMMYVSEGWVVRITLSNGEIFNTTPDTEEKTKETYKYVLECME